MVAGCDKVGREGGELVSDIAEVAGLGWLGDEYVDHRPDVVQSRDRRERWSAFRAEGPACHGEEQRGVDDLDGDAAVVERAGELAVGAAQLPAGAGSEAMEVEDGLDVEPARGGRRHGQVLTIGATVLDLG